MPLKRTDAELAYAAGIIDGEGCIRVNRQQGHPVVRVHVTNTDPRLTELLRTWFGGYVWTESKSYIPNAKVRYVWEVSATTAGDVLGLILPFLFLKRERAEIALAIQSTKNRAHRTTPEVRQERERLAATLRVLNKKGAA